MADKVYAHITDNKKRVKQLPIEFFQKNGYEKHLDKIFDFTNTTIKGDRRYWDSIWTDQKIELKKTKSNIFFLDMIRYSEMYLSNLDIMTDQIKYLEQAKQSTVTCFIKTKNQKISKIYILDTKDLYQVLKLTEERAKMHLEDYAEVKSFGQTQNTQRGIKLAHIEPFAMVVDFKDVYSFKISPKDVYSFKISPKDKAKRIRPKPVRNPLKLAQRLNILDGQRVVKRIKPTARTRAQILDVETIYSKPKSENTQTKRGICNKKERNIIKICKRIAVDNMFVVGELNKHIKELQRLCPKSFN